MDGLSSPIRRIAAAVRQATPALIGLAVLPVLAQPAVIATDAGPVRGLRRDDLYEFRGIPYAAPPLGTLRWRAPRPAPRWRAPLAATHFARDCPQVTTLGAFAGPWTTDEDCLYLNIFAPASGAGGRATMGAASRYPVIVWIHGGGNVAGGSRGYDGAALARGGPMGTRAVVVTFNYRVGLFGFLAHPALEAEPGLHINYGILDQQAALRWVRRNIAAFGGDPQRVTIAGQSAGAQDVAVHQLSPLSAGLFHRAIYQSWPWWDMAPIGIARAAGSAFARAAHCPGDASPAASACLRALPADAILRLQGTAEASGPFVVGPAVDGTVLPTTPLTAWTSGRINRTPILAGMTRDEASFNVGVTQYFAAGRAAMDEQAYVGAVQGLVGGAAYPGAARYPAERLAEVLAQYAPLRSRASPGETFAAMRTDTIACRAALLYPLWAQRVPLYAYAFDYRDGAFYFPAMFGYRPRAAHTTDIRFVFPGWHGGDVDAPDPSPFTAPEKRLSDRIIAGWTRFAATGNPNATGDRPWPRYAAAARSPSLAAIDLAGIGRLPAGEWTTRHRCAFWTGNRLEPSSGQTGGLLRLQP